MIVPKTTPSGTALALQAATGGLDLLGGGYEIYTDILQSRTIADRLIEKYQLKAVYGTKEQALAEQILAKRTSTLSAKEGLIRVTVSDTDAKRAADLANSYLDELDQVNQSLAITSAGQQRLYFERQLVKEKDVLANAEADLERLQQQTGILVPENQAQAHLTAVEMTRAQIRVRQVALEALLQGATNENPEVVRLRSEVSGLEGQLQAMQRGAGDETVGMPTSKTPAASLDYLRKAREVKLHEAILDMLSKEYEAAKQNEAKTVSMIQILDKATPPEHKSWPPRKVFLMLGLLGGAVLGIMYTFGEAFLQRVMENPSNRNKFNEILQDGRF
jgi:uncharacterized protein involved in exopolysaccharide biosynthesis